MDIIETLRGIVGPAQVLTGADCAGFDRDWTGIYNWTPLCVVRPGSTAEVSAVLKATYAAGVPVVPVSGNTGVSGGVKGDEAVMLSLARMNRIEEINAERHTARVEAGVVVAKLHEALAA